MTLERGSRDEKSGGTDCDSGWITDKKTAGPDTGPAVFFALLFRFGFFFFFFFFHLIIVEFE